MLQEPRQKKQVGTSKPIEHNQCWSQEYTIQIVIYDKYNETPKENGFHIAAKFVEILGIGIMIT